ncbi:aldo/keto reductase [Ornithinimicrobium humiphilum]|uniref:Aryl-alcohol dehydrogenase-like predicted oxidoreductase n=1 Tax=Ornithinimicrobium humiphilum TaxID=125288 RepID=A0A543KN99_9MICO|nr:aldo/keto reductase [Ornithinimicrobium humiphilum]TQM96550.1 aryl-alcohol dehydrogenase-like predicted oxidoreductase [Ornithinimicrobium humiphilum]
MPTLPGSSVEIFPVNLGGNAFGWTADEETSFAILDRFVELGGTFVDTADSYAAWVDEVGGQSETIIGRWLAARGNRDDVLVATKVARKPGRVGLAHDNVVAALEESLERLQTDHVDLYYAHYDDEDVPVADQVATFDELVRSGRVRSVGLSNFTPERLREWFETAREQGAAVPVALQPRYTLVSRTDFETSVAPIAGEFGAMVFSYPALASGFLTGKYRTEADLEGMPRGGAARRYLEAGGLRVVDELVRIGEAHGVEPATVALAWVLAKGVTAPIASVSRPAQLDALMAAPGLTLTVDEVAALDAASDGF